MPYNTQISICVSTVRIIYRINDTTAYTELNYAGDAVWCHSFGASVLTLEIRQFRSNRENKAQRKPTGSVNPVLLLFQPECENADDFTANRSPTAYECMRLYEAFIIYWMEELCSWTCGFFTLFCNWILGVFACVPIQEMLQIKLTKKISVSNGVLRIQQNISFI